MRSSDSGRRVSYTKIRVVAPATLEEDYTFDVLVSGKPYTVIVPPGGVREGEEFEVDYTVEEEDSADDHSEGEYDNDKNLSESYDEEQGTLPMQSASEEEDFTMISEAAPYGRWRHHLFACCDVVTQATFWMALCLPPVLIAQLLTRLGLNWKGKPDHPDEVNRSFNRIVLSFIGVLFLFNIPVLGLIAVACFTLLVVICVGKNARQVMRQRYRIPVGIKFLPEAVNDCICMTFCGCCSMVQMARHTHNDKEYPGYCCTNTGLELGAPKLV